MQTKSIAYQNKDVFYRLTGEGQTIMFLHGFAEDGEVWNEQVDFLKDKYRLIIPDIPGSGLSAFNAELSTIEDYAEAIKAILDNEQISNCVLIGHSMGGYIALAIAEKYPQLLRAFGLFHSTVFADSEEKKEMRLKAIDFIKANGAYPFLKTSIPGLFSNDFKINHSNKIEALIERGKKFIPEALIQYYHAMIMRPDRIKILESFSLPILFIIGEQDNIIPLQSSLQQCHIPSQSHMHILTNTAHMGMWEEAAKTNEILLEFLNT